MPIKLEKGQKIDLTKSSGAALTKFCVGVNWGAIETYKKGFFGGQKVVKTEVDLDLSCIMLHSDGKRWDNLYSDLYNPDALRKAGLPPGKLVSLDGALRHSGDDLTGDMDGDDGLDNEIISVDLTRVDPGIDRIFFFINNVGGEDFSVIPFAKIRMYEGTPERVDHVHAEFDVVRDPAYKGHAAMIMGKLYKRDGAWKFAAIGDATTDSNFAVTIGNIIKNYA